MEIPRSSGILVHITSLPSDFGIGDLGPAAYDFVDFLEASGHRYWQLLPLNPTDGVYSHSPYSSYSAFAGNKWLISPELLEKEGFIDNKDLDPPKGITAKKVHFNAVENFKIKILDVAYLNFKKEKLKAKEFSKFCKKHASWLDDFSLYKALRKKYNSGWTTWPAELRDRKKKALKSAKKELEDDIEKVKFVQFLFFSQWESLAAYAHKKQVQFIGDIPFYINHESADCWANADIFKLNKNKNPKKVSGVPPDYFSETGQLWGTPVFKWKALKKDNFKWWVERISQNLLLFDLVRIDHFRAFSAYWEVPAGEETAMNGKWVNSPGKAFFKKIRKKFPEMPFIAEDLGSLDEPVFELLQKFNFPGMKVLHFAFGNDKADNPYLPFNHAPHNLVYTGTHDNNTSRGWFSSAGKAEKKHLKEYTGKRVTSKNVHQILHKMALKSVAKLAVIPLQDIVGLDGEAVMNVPGTTKGNWTWRIAADQIPTDRAEELKKLNILYGRHREISNNPEKDEERIES